MKKISIISVFLAVILFGCNGKKTSATAKGDDLSFDSVVVDTILHLTDDPSSPSFTISFSLIYAKGKNAQTVNDSLLRWGLLVGREEGDTSILEEATYEFVKEALDEYKEFNLPLFIQDPEHYESLNHIFEVKTEAHNAYGNVINIIGHIYYYAGGAHSITATVAYNIDAKTGKKIDIGDICVPGYQPTLINKLTKKLMKRFNAKTEKDLMDKTFLKSSLYVPVNFIIGKDKITFIYGEYEIAPYSEGEIILEIDKSELTDILKK